MTKKKAWSDEGLFQRFETKKVAEVFVQYEGPKVFSFLSKTGGLFLAYFCDESESERTWLYLATNEYQLAMLLRDEMSVREFFQSVAAIFLCKADLNNKETAINQVSFKDIPADCLPEDGVFLEAPVSDFLVKIEKEGISPYSVHETSLVKIVTAFHKTFKKVMKELRIGAPEKYQGCPLEPKLALAGIYPGSVEVRLRVIEHNQLFSDAVEEIGRNIGETSPPQEKQKIWQSIRKELFPIIPNPNSRLFDFDSVTFSGKVASAEVKVPIGVKLTADIRQSYSDEIKKQKAETKSVVLVGLIREFDKDFESFSLRNIDPNPLAIDEVECVFEIDSVDADLQDILSYLEKDTKVQVAGEYNLKERSLEVQHIKAL